MTILPIKQVIVANDTNNQPLANGLLYTFISGSSIPFPTYVVYREGEAPPGRTGVPGGGGDMVYANPNPLPLDENGMAFFYLNKTIPYRFTLTNANGVTQPGYPLDGVTPSNVEGSLNYFSFNAGYPPAGYPLAGSEPPWYAQYGYTGATGAIGGFTGSGGTWSGGGQYPPGSSGYTGPTGETGSTGPTPPSVSWDLPSNWQTYPNGTPVTITITAPVGSTYSWYLDNAQSWYQSPDPNAPLPSGNAITLNRVDTGDLLLSCLVTLPDASTVFLYAATPNVSVTWWMPGTWNPNIYNMDVTVTIYGLPAGYPASYAWTVTPHDVGGWTIYGTPGKTATIYRNQSPLTHKGFDLQVIVSTEFGNPSISGTYGDA